MIEKNFYGLENWKCFYTEIVKIPEITSFKEEQIKKENHMGYIVHFNFIDDDSNKITIECYKKHSTSILKSILIGKFPIPLYLEFKSTVDQIVKQTNLLEQAIKKPEFNKYKLQKNLYFGL